jgi:hypothetical protein
LSRKQELLGALIKHAFVHLRGQFYATWRERLWNPFALSNRLQYNRDLANLMHRVGETVHKPDFTDTDISLLNWAVPHFLAKPSNQCDLILLDLLVQLHDCVPPDKADEITWHPSESLRQRLHEQANRNKELAQEWPQLLERILQR